MSRRGFTIVELIITISIMAILLTLGTISLSGSQANGRDSERKTDIESLSQHLETFYAAGTNNYEADCTGGHATYDGAYTIRTFKASGTLTCSGDITASVLVVAGGGGGGGGEGNPAGDAGGGGGGGGAIYNASFPITYSTYAVTVGSGGAGATGPALNGTAGNNSIFSTLTAISGGYGAKEDGVGGVGGSGGGGGGSCSTGNHLGGLGTAGQGYPGGTGIQSSCEYRGGGGGGGYAAAGSDDLSTSGGGSGGGGILNSISGAIVSYAGGGGGGAAKNVGALGGVGQARGGDGGSSPNGAGANATANSGSGGGGAGSGTNIGGAGGAGIVIVRYLSPAGIGTYPSTAITATSATITKALRDIDTESVSAPGITDPTITFKPATNNVQTTSGVTPQPTIDQYIYQPLQQDGTLCTAALQQCQKFNLYYRLEADNTIYVATSKNQ